MISKKMKAAQIVIRLKQYYPDADCTLDYTSGWQLLVAAILSAQCTDARVNQITPVLFEQYPDLPSLAAAEPEQLSATIRSCGLYRSKTRSILGASSRLLNVHDGQMPQDMKELTDLPGVGRKIANLILGDYFHIPAIVVDTHCSRISQRIGLTSRQDPPGIENDLQKCLDPTDWIDYGHLMVRHGRDLCMARSPDCYNCPIADLCQTGLDKVRAAQMES